MFPIHALEYLCRIYHSHCNEHMADRSVNVSFLFLLSSLPLLLPPSPPPPPFSSFSSFSPPLNRYFSSRLEIMSEDYSRKMRDNLVGLVDRFILQWKSTTGPVSAREELQLLWTMQKQLEDQPDEGLRYSLFDTIFGGISEVRKLVLQIESFSLDKLYLFCLDVYPHVLTNCSCTHAHTHSHTHSLFSSISEPHSVTPSLLGSLPFISSPSPVPDTLVCLCV